MKNKTIALFLAVAVLAFNMVILPASHADEGQCSCDHSHDEGGYACFCGESSLKHSCGAKGPSLSKRQCGLGEKSHDFCIPANEYPTLLSSERADLSIHASILSISDTDTVSGIESIPIERPPSIL